MKRVLEYFKSQSKNRIFVAVICLIALLLVTEISYSAYTSQAYMRGVVRNRDNEAVRFSSNYLDNYVQGNDSYVSKRVTFKDDISADTVSLDIVIYNHAKGIDDQICQNDIEYDITISLEGGKGALYVIDGNEFNSGTCTYTKNGELLMGRTNSEKHYTIQFPKADLDYLQITAVATPRDMTITGNQFLAALLRPCAGVSTIGFNGEGKFIDKLSGKAPNEFDGYNYEVLISSGKANATITWNNTVLEMDEHFLAKIGKTKQDIIINQGLSSLNINMNTQEGTGEYLIQFYILDKETIENYTWEQMEGLVTFEATEI